jgi:hypothetical protein
MSVARSTSASQPRRLRADLQPGRSSSGAASEPSLTRIAPIELRLLAEAEAEALGGGEELSLCDRASAKRAAENLARRNQEVEKINTLACKDSPADYGADLRQARSGCPHPQSLQGHLGVGCLAIRLQRTRVAAPDKR